MRIRTAVSVDRWRAFTEDKNAVGSMADMLGDMLDSWEGFDMPPTRESIGKLQTTELNVLFRLAMEAMQNP
jgi:hypothetical protein